MPMTWQTLHGTIVKARLSMMIVNGIDSHWLSCCCTHTAYCCMSEPNSMQLPEVAQEVSPSTSATPSAEGPPKSSYESSYSSSYSSYCACCACALMAALSAAPALSKNRDTPCEQAHRYSPQKTASRQAFLSRCHPLAPNLHGSHGKFSAR